MAYYINSTEIGAVLSAGTQNPAVVSPGVSVNNTTTAHSGDAIYGSATYVWTLTNNGIVSTYAPLGAAAFAGVDLRAGGTVTNAGTGQIIGYQAGVYITGGQGTVSNSSTIQGTGTISSGVDLRAGGVVNNTGAGQITGYLFGAYVGGGLGTVNNAATIAGTGTAGTGVDLKAGGVVSNTGTITSALNAVYAGGSASVSNAGTIIGTGTAGTGIDLYAGGSVNNLSGGVISGSSNAAFVVNGSVANAGTIAGDVWLRFGGTLSNASGAGIAGGRAGVYADGNATIVNAGSISATGATGIGVDLQTDGTISNTGSIGAGGNGAAVNLGTAGTLTNQLGGVVSAYYNVVTGQGTVVNYGTINSTGTLGHAINITGTGVIVNHGTITNNSLANVNKIQNAAVAVHNSTGIVRNLGTIANTGIYDAVRLNNGGIVANYDTIAGGLNGVEVLAASGTVNNIGTITGADLGGTSGSGVNLSAGGTVVNGNVDLHNPLIEGYDGVRISGPGGTLVNWATIASTGTGFGAQGVDFLSGGTLTNYYTITGTNTDASGINAGFAPDSIANGAPGNTGALIAGWLNGIDQFSSAGTVANFGTVVATNGDGIYLQAGGTVTNSGTAALVSGYSVGIQVSGAGSVNNSGTIASTGTDGLAIEISGNGTVINYGTVQHSALNGTGAAIFLGNGGSIGNYGLIDGAGNQTVAGKHSIGVIIVHGLPGSSTVSNFGTIATTNTGENAVNLDGGGTLTNGPGTGTPALISASNTGVYVGGTNGVPTAGALGFIYNYGTIQNASPASDAVRLVSGGTVFNSGVVIGQRSGISFVNAAGTLTNAGTIVSNGTTSGAGVYLGGGGTVANDFGGLITGYRAGLSLKNVAGTVVNYGSISSRGTYFSGVYLGAGGVVTNGTSGIIDSVWVGVDVKNVAGTVLNLGRIDSTATFLSPLGFHAPGVLLQQGGLVVNGAATATNAVITGYERGVYIGGNKGVSNPGAVGTLINYGTVSSTGTGVNARAAAELTSGGTINNYGTIVSYGRNAIMVGGTVAGTVNNLGLIENFAAHAAIYSRAGGGVTNSGTATISSTETAISFRDTAGTTVSFGTVVNSGSIVSTSTGATGVGIYFGQGGTLTNQPGGVIQAYRTAVSAKGSPAAITNQGVISSTGTGFAGIYLGAGGNVANLGTGGLIEGSYAGIHVTGGSGTVSNLGTIAGLGTGVAAGIIMRAGGSVANGSAAAPGAQIVGNQKWAVFVDGGTGTVTNAGKIQGLGTYVGVYLKGGGNVTNYAGGLIAGPGIAGVAIGDAGGTVSNAGSITGLFFHNGGSVGNTGQITAANQGIEFFAALGGAGTVNNAGTIVETGAGKTTGVDLAAGGLVTNLSVGVISGGYYGVTVRGGGGTVINAGLLANTAGYRAAAYMTVGGAVINQQGGLIDGGVAIAGAASVSNLGTISVLRNNTNIGIGIGAGGTVSNGQSASSGGVITGERFGIEIYGGAGAVTNYGTITAVVGTGVKFGSAGSTLTNAGTITGAGGTAVGFTGGGNTLVALQGAMFSGAIYGGGGGNDVLDLAAAGASGGAIGYGIAPISGFDRLMVDAGANWQLVGSETFAAGATVGVGATLALGGTLVLGGNLGDSGSVEIGAGAALTLQGGASGGGNIDFLTPTGALQIAGATMPANPIGGFAQGDSIDLPNISATGIAYTGGVATLTSGTTPVAQLTIATPYGTGASFAEARDAAGGTVITVNPPVGANYLPITGFPKTNNIETALIKEFPSGIVTGNQRLAVPFDVAPDVAGNNFSEIHSSLTINVSIPQPTNLYTLINAYTPPPGALGATIDFIGDLGTTETFNLVYGTDVRDFFQGTFANTINGTTTQNMFTVTGVTDGAATGNVNTGLTGTYNIDEQNFALAPAFAGQVLQQIVITNVDAAAVPILLGATAQTAITETVVSGGQRLVVSNGQVLSGVLVLSGGVLEIASGGTVSAAQVAAAGQEVVDAGGIDVGAIVTSGAVENVSGIASGTQVLGGGGQTVEAGGRTVAVALDASATQLVSGVASGTTVSSGGMLGVANGGTAVSSIVLGGGQEIVAPGASDQTATLSGGTQNVFGNASNAVIDSGGVQFVGSGGIASGTTVSAGGSAVIAGGRLAIASGGAVSGAIGFTLSGGTLEIGSNQMPTGPIGGVALGDAFDLRAMPFAAGDTVSFAGGTLAVTSGALTDTLTLSGAAPGIAFRLSSDLQGGTLVTAVPAAATVNLFDFVFTYTDGADYYFGTVADDGRYQYLVNEQIPGAKGQYLIYNEEGLPAAAPPGTVVVLAYSHGGPGAASPVPVLTAAGTPDGSNGLTSESDFVPGVDGQQHPFSNSQEATFNTVALFGFVFRYADGRAFYTGTVAGTAALPAAVVAGSYTVFAEGMTTEAAGTVVIDRFSENGASYIPTGSAGGSQGLGSEAGVLTVAGSAFAFGPTTEPFLPTTITVVAAPAPSATDLISAEVDQVYNDILGRNPDPGGLATYSAALAGGLPLATVRQEIAASPEAQNDLNGLYQQVLGRNIDPSGMATFTTFLASGGSLATVQQLLAQSPEAQADLETIYQEVLNRSADPSGLATYTAALGNQTSPLSLGLERNIIAHSTEAQNDLINLFQATVSPSRPPSAAELTGMEDQLATTGVSQQSLASALASTGSAGGFTTVTPSGGNSDLTASSGVPTVFDFSSVAFGQDTIAGFDTTRDTVKLPVALVANFTTLQQQDLSASAAGALITLGSQSITLSGVSPPSLGPANFLFG